MSQDVPGPGNLVKVLGCGGFLSHGGTPASSILDWDFPINHPTIGVTPFMETLMDIDWDSSLLIIQLLGYPHDYGTPPT